MEKREILSHQKKFRQINSLVTYVVKPLLSRTFYQKCVRENSRNFHTVHWAVEITEINSHAFLTTISWKQRFTGFTKVVINQLITREKNFGERKSCVVPHCTLSQKFREINFFTKDFYSNLIWRKIFRVAVNFSFFHTVHCVRAVMSLKNISSNQLFCNFISKNVGFTNFLPKKYEST